MQDYTSLIATGIAGLVFLWTGILKAVSPRTFQAHLAQLGWIPRALINVSVLIVTAVEAVIGTALIVGLNVHFVTMIATIALIAFSATTIIAVHSGRTNDCGCYAGYFSPSLAQTLSINAAVVLLLLAAHANPQRPVLSEFQSTLIVIGITVAVTATAAVALNAWVKRGERFFDDTPIKVGRPWSNKWSASQNAKTQDEVFVVYLGRECPFCKRWIPVLNAMNEHNGLPPVLGVVGESAKRAREYQVASGARFPLQPISKSLVNRLVDGVPTVVLMRHGKIADIWSGEISHDFLGRFKQAFFPEPVRQSG